MPIKKNDFVEIEYTGTLKEEKIVFDTTDAKVAQQQNIQSQSQAYGPVIICVGEGHVVKGLDKFLENKDTGKFSVELQPDDAFGKKDAKLIAMIPAKKFIEQKIRPIVGLQVNIDGYVGVIRTVTGGRTIVDFNHPLSGKVVVYDVKINRIITDKKEKAQALGKLLFGKHAKMTVEGDSAKVEAVQDVPEPLAKELQKKFQDLTGINLSFVKKEPSKEDKKPKSADAKQ